MKAVSYVYVTTINFLSPLAAGHSFYLAARPQCQDKKNGALGGTATAQ